MDTLIAILLGSIVFLSAMLIGMALMLRKQWDPQGSATDTRHSASRPRRTGRG